jgi:Tfp pilus assembly protein PilW
VKKRAGLGLIEILVATCSSLLVLAAVGGFARAEARLLDREARRLRLREASRRVLDLVVREIRGTGFAPTAGTFDGAADGLSIAAPDRIEIRSDWHGSSAGTPPDGVLDPDSDERTGFFLNASRGIVAETVGRQTLSLTLDSMVPADGLLFRYFDVCGLEITPASGPELSADERAKVRRVAVSLVVRERGGETITAEASSALRNRTGLECG